LSLAALAAVRTGSTLAYALDTSWISGPDDRQIGGSVSMTERAEYARLQLRAHINAGRPPWAY
jgi:hypothetical protein